MWSCRVLFKYCEITWKVKSWIVISLQLPVPFLCFKGVPWRANQEPTVCFQSSTELLLWEPSSSCHQYGPAFQGSPTFSTSKESLNFSTDHGPPFEGLVHLAVALSDTELSPPLMSEWPLQWCTGMTSPVMVQRISWMPENITFLQDISARSWWSALLLLPSALLPSCPCSGSSDKLLHVLQAICVPQWSCAPPFSKTISSTLSRISWCVQVWEIRTQCCHVQVSHLRTVRSIYL